MLPTYKSLLTHSQNLSSWASNPLWQHLMYPVTTVWSARAFKQVHPSHNKQDLRHASGSYKPYIVGWPKWRPSSYISDWRTQSARKGVSCRLRHSIPMSMTHPRTAVSSCLKQYSVLCRCMARQARSNRDTLGSATTRRMVEIASPVAMMKHVKITSRRIPYVTDTWGNHLRDRLSLNVCSQLSNEL